MANEPLPVILPVSADIGNVAIDLIMGIADNVSVVVVGGGVGGGPAVSSRQTPEERSTMEVAERIGGRVKQLREERSWTQQALAAKVGVSQSTIAGVEGGDQLPGTALLGRIADVFQVELDFFYRVKENPFELLLRAQGVGEEHRSAFGQFAERCLRYREIEESLSIEVMPTPQYPPTGRHARVIDYAERLADQERLRLDVGIDPLLDLPRVLEAQGVRVMGVDLGGDFDGLFLFAEEEGCFILVNTRRVKERQLFTLAHEYGHILMHRGQGYRLDYDIFSRPRKGDVVEMAANAFAAAFLMPRATISALWDKKERHDVSKLIWLRRSLGVSYNALGWRLMNLGFITPAERELMDREEEANKTKERLLYGEELDSGVEIPRFSDRQRFLAIKAFLSGGVSISKLAEWLEIDVVKADEIAKALSDGEQPRVPSAG